MLAFTTLFTLAGFASTSFAAAIPDNRNGCPSNRWFELQTGQCVNAGYGCPSYPQTFRNVAIQGTYPDPVTMTCIQCPYGAWECPNGVPKQCYIDGTVLVDGKCAPEAECLATGNKFVAKSYNTNPLRYHRFCNDCENGKSAWKSNYQCDTCQTHHPTVVLPFLPNPFCPRLLIG